MRSGKPKAGPSVGELAEIAIAAGAAILDIYARPLVAATKADGSPVTEADLRSEDVIQKRLSAAPWRLPVFSEEQIVAGEASSPGARFLLVDPLDGTKEFLSRNGEFTVNIALIENGAPVMGVVYLPAQSMLYHGSDHGAARALTDEGRMSDVRAIHARKPGEGLDVVASRSHMTPETEDFLRRFKVRSFKQAGSSLKFCRIAEGAADLYPRLGRTMWWDTAAGHAVLRAAGGNVLKLDGTPLAYGTQGRTAGTFFGNPDFVACGDFDPFAGAAP